MNKQIEMEIQTKRIGLPIPRDIANAYWKV
jgi:hypothetical protein